MALSSPRLVAGVVAMPPSAPLVVGMVVMAR